MYRSASQQRIASVYQLAELLHRSGIRIASAEDIDHFLISGTRTLKQAGLFDFMKGLRGDPAAPTPSEIKESAAKVVQKAKKEADSSDRYVYEQVDVLSKELQRLGYMVDVKSMRGQFNLDSTMFRKVENGQPMTFKDLVTEARINKKIMPFIERLHNLHTFAKTVYTGQMDSQAMKAVMGGLGKLGDFLIAAAEFLGLSIFYVVLAFIGVAGLAVLLSGGTLALSTTAILTAFASVMGIKVIQWLAAHAGGLLDKFVRFRTASQRKVALQDTVIALLSHRP